MNLKPIIALLGLCTINQGAHAAGQLDPSYGVGGYLDSTPNGVDFTVFDVANDGSFVAAGVGEADCAVTALNASGTVDHAWGDGGLLRFPCMTALRPAVLRQPDGRTLIAHAADSRTLVVSRFATDATLDASFGIGGSVSIAVPGSLYDAVGMLATDDGYLWVVATGSAGFGIRMEADGANPVVVAVASELYPDRDVPFDLRGLIANEGGSVNAVLAGYKLSRSDGVHDDGLTFVHFDAGTGQAATRSFSWEYSYFSRPAIDVVGPQVYAAFQSADVERMAILRFVPTGEDLRFGRFGRLELDDTDLIPHSITADAAGRLYLSGWLPGCGIEPEVCSSRRGISVFQPDGLRATDFGQGGTAYLDYGDPMDARALHLAPAGRVLSIGGTSRRLGAARLDLGAGSSPGRLGLFERHTFRDAGYMVGASHGNETTIYERSTTLTFRVSRSGGDQGAVSVRYRIAGDALAGGTYVPADGTLDWADGDTSDREVPLSLQSDPRVNEGGIIQLILEDPSGGATLGTATHTIRVLDASPGQIEFGSPYELSTPERLALLVPVRRTGGGNGAVSVTLRPVFTSTSGAAASADDLASAGAVTISWADGETGYRALRVEPIDDQQDEPDERFTLELQDVTGGATLGVASVTITIMDNDIPSASGGGSSPGGGGSRPSPTGGGGVLRWIDLLFLLGLAMTCPAVGRGRVRCSAWAWPAPSVPIAQRDAESSPRTVDQVERAWRRREVGGAPRGGRRDVRLVGQVQAPQLDGPVSMRHPEAHVQQGPGAIAGAADRPAEDVVLSVALDAAREFPAVANGDARGRERQAPAVRRRPLQPVAVDVRHDRRGHGRGAPCGPHDAEARGRAGRAQAAEAGRTQVIAAGPEARVGVRIIEAEFEAAQQRDVDRQLQAARGDAARIERDQVAHAG